MSKTPFSDKVFILHEFYLEFLGTDEFANFFRLNDLGLPLAVAIQNGGATATPTGQGWIEETWKNLCEVIKVDHHGEYESLSDLMEMAMEDE
jgi:hypothetical protein